MSRADELFSVIFEAGLLIENSWTVRQSDSLDKRTSHIYSCETLADLSSAADQRNLSSKEQMYAIHRWRNFKRHDAWLELLYEVVPLITPSSDSYHKSQDFLIESNGTLIPFDLKVTRYPHSAPIELTDKELAEWFYKNQSTQGRFHLANRFFVVGEPESALYDINLARSTVLKFSEKMANYRFFIDHKDGSQSRAVILRQTAIRQ